MFSNFMSKAVSFTNGIGTEESGNYKSEYATISAK